MSKMSHEELLDYADYSCFDAVVQGGVDGPPDVRNGAGTPRAAIVDGYPRLYIEYSCDEGYQLQGKRMYMYCHQNSWLGDKPVCTKGNSSSICISQSERFRQDLMGNKFQLAHLSTTFRVV